MQLSHRCGLVLGSLDSSLYESSDLLEDVFIVVYGYLEMLQI